MRPSAPPSRHIQILTGEPSGDVHGADLVDEIRKIIPSARFSGIGGPCLKRSGVDLFFDIKELTVMGLVEVFAQLSHIRKAFYQFRSAIIADRPDLLILVDYPGFNLKAAAVAKSAGIPVLYYITPKVWAWKKSRLKTIKKTVDHAALIFPFELRLFQKAGIPATFVGNPLLDRIPEVSRPAGHLCVDESSPIRIGLLPGSRKNEIHALLEPMLQAATLISETRQNVQFLVSQAESAEGAYVEKLVRSYGKKLDICIVKKDVTPILAKACLVIAASGTVTLEAAVFGVPTIIIYKVAPLTFFLGKRVIQLDWVGLPNIIAQKQVMPELLQSEATPENISRTALSMLAPEKNLSARKQLKQVKLLLGSKGAARRTARIAKNMMKLAF